MAGVGRVSADDHGVVLISHQRGCGASGYWKRVGVVASGGLARRVTAPAVSAEHQSISVTLERERDSLRDRVARDSLREPVTGLRATT